LTAPNVASRSPQDRPRRPRTPQRAPQETPRGSQDRLFFILGYVFAVLSRWLNVFNGFSINLRTRVCDPKSSKTSVPWGLAHETVRERCKKTPKSRSQVGVAGKNGPLLPQIRGFTTVCRIPQNRRICKNHCFQDSFNVLNSQQSILFSLLSSRFSLLKCAPRGPKIAPRALKFAPRASKSSRDVERKVENKHLNLKSETHAQNRQRGAARDERSEDLESEVRLATGQPQTAGNRRQREITTTKANVRRQRSLPNPEDGRVALRWTPKRPEVPEQPHVQSCHTSV